MTCFFIDTAKNIMAYIELINQILKKGGVWINLGFLFHFFQTSRGYACERCFGVEEEIAVAGHGAIIVPTSSSENFHKSRFACSASGRQADASRGD